MRGLGRSHPQHESQPARRGCCSADADLLILAMPVPSTGQANRNRGQLQPDRIAFEMRGQSRDCRREIRRASGKTATETLASVKRLFHDDEAKVFV